MQKSIIKLIVKSFITWMGTKFQPSGLPCLHDLQARCVVIIDALPDGLAPDLGPVEKLSETGIRNGLEWMFNSLISSNTGDSWAVLAVHSMKVLAIQAIPDIITLIITTPLPKNSGQEYTTPTP